MTKRNTTSLFEQTNEFKTKEKPTVESPIFFDLLDQLPQPIGSIHDTAPNTNLLPFTVYNSHGFTYGNFVNGFRQISGTTSREVIPLTEREVVNTELTGLCDGRIPEPRTSTAITPCQIQYHSLDHAIQTLDKRRSLFLKERRFQSTQAEHVFSSEVPKASIIADLSEFGRVMSSKDITRYFLLMTYDGIANHLERVYQSSKFLHPTMDFHRRANFNEMLEYDRKPYKIYMDLEYQCLASNRRLNASEAVDDFFTCYTFFVGAIGKIVHRLHFFWKRMQELDMKHPLDDAVNKIPQTDNLPAYCIYDSTRFPEPDKQKNGDIGKDIYWKLSFHIIWYPVGVRFATQGSAFAFLLSALSLNPETGVYEENFMNAHFTYKGEPIIDTGVYTNTSFRAPYNAKFTSYGKFSFCPCLKPVGGTGSVESLRECLNGLLRMDRESLLDNVGSVGELVTFNKELFFKGLIHYIGDERIDVLLELDLSNLPSDRCFLLQQFPNICHNNHITLNENIHRLVQRFYTDNMGTATILPCDQADAFSSTSIDLPPSESSKEDVKHVLRLLVKYLAKEVCTVCKTKYNSVSKQPQNFSFTFQSPEWLVVEGCDLFIFWTTKYAAMPCLASMKRGYKPHRNNNNYVILNVHTFDWYMGCHDSECISEFRAGLHKNHPKKMVPPGITPGSRGDPLKAKSPNYSLSPSSPNGAAALFYCKQVSSILKKLKRVAGDDVVEMNAHRVERRADMPKIVNLDMPAEEIIQRDDVASSLMECIF